MNKIDMTKNDYVLIGSCGVIFYRVNKPRRIYQITINRWFLKDRLKAAGYKMVSNTHLGLMYTRDVSIHALREERDELTSDIGDMPREIPRFDYWTR